MIGSSRVPDLGTSLAISILQNRRDALGGSSCRMFREEPLDAPMCFPSGALQQLPQTRTRGFPKPRPNQAVWKRGSDDPGPLFL
jgi:hypothetical protein